MPGSSVVAKWKHFAAAWKLWALRGRSEVSARTEMQIGLSWAATNTVVWCWLLVLVLVPAFGLDVLPCCE